MEGRQQHMKCEEARELMCIGAPGELQTEQDKAVTKHLQVCLDCLVWCALKALGAEDFDVVAGRVYRSVESIDAVVEDVVPDRDMLGLSKVAGNESAKQKLPEITKIACHMCHQDCWVPPKAKKAISLGLKPVCEDCFVGMDATLVRMKDHERFMREAKNRHRIN